MSKRPPSKPASPPQGLILESRPGRAALCFRVISLVIVLSQLAIPLLGLSSPAIGVSILLLSAIAAYAIHASGIRTGLAIPACAAIPFALRAIAFLSLGLRAAVSPGPASDGLFPAFDQAFFPAYLPAVWMGVSSVLAARSLPFLRAESLLNALIFTAAFWSESGFKLQKYPHPSLLALAAGSFIACEAARLAFAERGATRGRGKKAFILPATVLPLLALLFLFLLGRYSDRATASGGGLIKPTLSRFDFSEYLKLESEISLSKDLVLFVKKDPADPNIFLRRHVLAGYDEKKGFYSEDRPWSEKLPDSLPGRLARYDPGSWKGRKDLEQEYYIVNFDSGAFIAMNAPSSSVPLGNWDQSSFRSIYRAESSVPGPAAYEALPAADGPSAGVMPGMEGDAYRYYTDYGEADDIAELARAATAGAEGYYAGVVAVEEYLRSNYRYSLKPGVSKDGDQLRHFLFESKKGYCSYFAFSMTLMLRSLGVPARVAVGFFIEPGSNVLSLYPVRADMAHAWVEVFFPGYGWIDFDPTSDILAEGEKLELGGELDPERYIRLIQEILSNRDKLAPTESPTTPASLASLALARTREAILWAVSRWYLTLPLVLVLALAGRRLARAVPVLLARKPRKKALALFGRAMAFRADSGFRRGKGESGQEYCAAIDALCASGDAHVRLSLLRDKALYGPRFSLEDGRAFEAALLEADAAFRKTLKPSGAIAAFFFLPSLRRSRRRRGPLSTLVILLALSSLQGQAGGPSASDILADAERAMDAENFDVAANLFKSGEAQFPQSPEFPRKLGYLYYDKELYSLAMDEFRRAEKLVPEDAAMIYTMSDALARLNKEKDSIAYLKRTLELDPGNRDAVSDLGWMYFKVHQTDQGIELIEKAEKEFGFDKGFEMTLGTLYSERYEYALSKKHYLASIDSALETGADNFAGVAYYNLSILESKYYNFREAVKLAEKSIEHYDRASAHLARGELAQKALDLAKASSEFELAYAYDTSPLSSLSLADIALDSGRLEEARSICEEALKRSDHSWMVNFGTDLDSHTMDIYDILQKAYAGLSRTVWRRPASNPLEALSAWAASAEYAARSWYCRERYRKLSRSVAESYWREGSVLLADLHFYNSLEGYPSKALPYLSRASAYETALVPMSAPSYRLERALLLKDIPAALEAAQALQQPWEGDILVDGLARAGRLMKARGMGRELAMVEERLFSLNRGSLLQAGLSLPASIRLEADSGKARRFLSGALKRSLDWAGFDFGKGSERRYELSLALKDGTLTAWLSEKKSGRNIAFVSEGVSGTGAKDAKAMAEKILAAAFDAQDR